MRVIGRAAQTQQSRMKQDGEGKQRAPHIHCKAHRVPQGYSYNSMVEWASLRWYQLQLNTAAIMLERWERIILCSLRRHCAP